MERAIYYPGFEVRNLSWLKFALLYIDRLLPIVPPRGDETRSKWYQRLSEQTDLIHPHRPEYREGSVATLDAISEVEKMLARPEDYSRIFRTSDISILWRSKDEWNYSLYEEKFSHAWVRFCEKNGLGRYHKGFLWLERSLGLLYMSILANAISEAQQISAITDDPMMDDISLGSRVASPQSPQQFLVASSIIKMQLPKNLKGIPLETIVKHRNRSGYKEKLHAFHRELAKWMSDVESGEAEGDFFTTRGSLFKDFSDDVTALGVGTISFSVLATMAIVNVVPTPEMIQHLTEAGVPVTGSVIALRNTWRSTWDGRFTRKFMADLARLR